MESNDTFKDTYRYGNNYIKKVVENGGIPLLIPYINDKVIYESLSMCDGLLLPGGSKVIESNFKVIDYFYKSNKPILGICLGMQTIAMYSINREYENKRIIKKVDTGINHWPIELNRDNNEDLAHKVYIEENSKLFDIFNCSEMMVNSVHKYTIDSVGSEFKISIKSEDGLIEGIECIDDNRFVIGVQFHPEILPQYNVIFEEFIKRCKNQK